MTVPVHPIQSVAEYPAWGSYTDHNDDSGRYGPTLAGRGLDSNPASIAPRFAAIGANANRVLGRCEYRCSATNSANGYEGIALVVLALKRVGNYLQLIWWNDPFSSGNTDWFINDNSDSWKRGQIIVDIPNAYTPDYIATCWSLRAQADGVCHFNSLELDTLETTAFTSNVGVADWSTTDAFTTEVINPQGILGENNSAGESAIHYIKYLEQFDIDISSGAELQMMASMYADTAIVVGNDGGGSFSIPREIGMGLRLKKSDGTFDYWFKRHTADAGLTAGASIGVLTDLVIAIDAGVITPDSYTAVQPFVYQKRLDAGAGTLQNVRISHKGIRFSFTVGNPLATGTT